ncbi:Uncharacterised protein [Bordetella pertussis]|nr:Uncharacterised protein [Bordetella pertussis]CPL58673.1 Uncharacterised protein [Bordetella pertussis]CPN44335.1 Uncharacterised protein [Bordetella pertussis]
MPRYSGFCRSAHDLGTGLPRKASTLTMKPSVPEWMANHLPSGSFMPSGIASQCAGL